MTRSSFVQLAGVSLDKLLLDTKNPRIRAGADQADCIERLLRKPNQLLTLAKDIATNGLSTAPILVEPRGKKYVVWDGNRRVTALKLLNDPSLCPKRALQTQFAGIASRAKVSIPSSVDVLASSDKDALLKEVLSRHAGGLDGAGQLNWDALLRTMFLLGHKASTEYRLSGLLLMWAEEHGIEVDDSFPITNIHRFLNRTNLGRLGFVVSDDGIETTNDKDVAVRLVERLVTDFAPSGSVAVADVFSQSQQDAYIDQVLRDLGLLTSAGDSGAAHGANGGSQGEPAAGPGRGGAEDAAGETKGQRGSKGGATRPKAPRKPDWDRKSVVRSRFKPEFPDDMWKADEVLRELRRLDTAAFPISAAALFRMFFELSTRYYMKRFKTVQTNEIHKNALAVAKHMREHGRIDQGELDATNRRLKDRAQAEVLLQYATLNDYIHSFKNIPDRQSLHVLWTEVEAYLEACWNHSRRPQ